eukprot:COSAG02_NODE_1122_length_14450_cov_4.124173_6_plen_225_part_00
MRRRRLERRTTRRRKSAYAGRAWRAARAAAASASGGSQVSTRSSTRWTHHLAAARKISPRTTELSTRNRSPVKTWMASTRGVPTSRPAVAVVLPADVALTLAGGRGAQAALRGWRSGLNGAHRRRIQDRTWRRRQICYGCVPAQPAGFVARDAACLGSPAGVNPDADPPIVLAGSLVACSSYVFMLQARTEPRKRTHLRCTRSSLATRLRGFRASSDCSCLVAF